MADGENDFLPEEHVNLAVLNGARFSGLLILDLSGPEHDEQRVLVTFELRPLMGRQRVLDCEIVEPELLLHLAKERLVGLEEANPHDESGALDDVADVVERHVADPPAVRIRDAGNDAARGRQPIVVIRTIVTVLELPRPRWNSAMETRTIPLCRN